MWIYRAWQFHNQQVEHRVHEALRSTAKFIEKKPKGHPNTYSKKKITPSNTSTEVKVVASDEEGGRKVWVTKTISSSDSEPVNKRIVLRSSSSNERFEWVDDSDSSDTGMYVGEYITSLVSNSKNNDNDAINQVVRIDIDSILRDRFKEERISSSYNYAIMSSKGDKMNIVHSSKGFDASRPIRKHVIQLYPHSKGRDPLKLVVDFGQSRKSFPLKLGGLSLLSLIFTSFLIWAFWYSVTSLLRQKKIVEVKSDILNNFTHEFKTPLSTILLAADSLKLDKIKGDKKEVENYADIIKSENKRMLGHVERMLNLVKADRGELALIKKDENVGRLLSRVIKSFDLILKERNGKLTVQIENQMLSIDHSQMFHVFANIIDNSIKYSSDTPEILVTGKMMGNYYEIEIRDNGIGMDDKTKMNVFSSFYRASSGNIQNVKGYGLGLSYSKSIVELHDGKIGVESELGKGTTINVILPIE